MSGDGAGDERVCFEVLEAFFGSGSVDTVGFGLFGERCALPMPWRCIPNRCCLVGVVLRAEKCFISAPGCVSALQRHPARNSNVAEAKLDPPRVCEKP